MRKRGEGEGEMVDALGVSDVSSVIKCRGCVLGVGNVTSVGKCRGCMLGDGFLNLQFNTSKRTLKAVRREGNPTVREETRVGTRNYHATIGRPHPPEENPTMREEAGVGDGKPMTQRNGKATTVVQKFW
jgi:hypothetical protein